MVSVVTLAGAGDIDANPRIYRFLYLDFERVRSLAAMVFGGAPEAIGTVAEHRSRTATKGNVGIPLVGGAEVGGDLLYLRTAS